ncbi:MAG: SDR family NAD(P)-dependent oxidoreductase [Deltaproteobacteria bacterium]|jgi:3-oxoacyl-[acyl-carrier protein] reductase|nr:SDR family NAD(P)-dependent oxidoreductase [Deltaproteobacteria bacterium]
MAEMKNIVAVVTGGTRGIGLAIAECLVKHRASVAITYKGDPQAAERAQRQFESLLADKQRILLLRGDAGDAKVVAAHHRTVRTELGPIGVLVNNAGIMPARNFENISVQDWEETIRVNLNSAFYWCRQVVADMKAMQFGRIVNISSIAARGGGVVGPHYAASKAGMLGLTRYGARELGRYGITVNAIAPAFIEDAGIFADWSVEKKADLKQKIFVSRLGNAGDVVRAFEYLLASPFVTGVTLDVNGGAFMI